VLDHGTAAARAEPIGGYGTEVRGQGRDRGEDAEIEPAMAEAISGEGLGMQADCRAIRRKTTV